MKNWINWVTLAIKAIFKQMMTKKLNNRKETIIYMI